MLTNDIFSFEQPGPDVIMFTDKPQKKVWTKMKVCQSATHSLDF